MYLIDTNVVSELRKKQKANKGVLAFIRRVTHEQEQMFISVVSVGELRRGVDLIRHRGDTRQSNLLEKWLVKTLDDYEDQILDIDLDVAQLWGRLLVPNPQNAIDKQIAATALIYDLTVVTRNEKHFQKLGLNVVNPFN